MAEELVGDVAVVGAGPAGAAAAITLARAGHRVVLVDRARFPREKCCGDGLTTGALRRLERLGLDPGEVASLRKVEDLAVRSPSGRVVHLPLGPRGSLEPLGSLGPRGSLGPLGARGGGAGMRAAVARRLDLDAALVDLARRSGAVVVEGRGLEAIEPGSAPVLRLAGGVVVRAGYVVGADGAHSPLRRLLAADGGDAGVGSPGAPAPSSERVAGAAPDGWHAFRCYARNVGVEAAGSLWVWFPASILPGYAWSFPLPGGAANVGICLRRRGGGAGLAGAWRDLLASSFLESLLGPQAEIDQNHRSWPIPTRLSIATLTGAAGRVLFAGDAAGAADPFTGEGIAQALECGMAAGEAIAGGGRPVTVAAAYRSRIAATLAVEHRLAGVARAVMSRPLSARGAIRATGWSPWTRDQVGRFLYEDYPRSEVLSPWRWRLGTDRGGDPYSGWAEPAPADRPFPIRGGSLRNDGPGR